MKKNLFINLLLLLSVWGINPAKAQNPFKFLKVDYIGAIGTEDWTKGWTNWNPELTNYPIATETTTLNAASTGGTGYFNISNTVTLDSSKVYLLTGIIYIKSGGTLIIPSGTIIRCEGNSSGTPANWATILVQRGGKIISRGTKNSPVVFTSNKNAGSRKPGDWGGIILLGKATNNAPGAQSNCPTCVKGEAIIEGPFATEGIFGGNDDADNSGQITYTRIEFPGLVFSPNNEINGLTMGSVGYNTTLRNIQISYSNDDSYEWFGGTVNSKYLIAYKTTDDDFDTDFGYSGMNQFGIGFKDSLHFDPTYGAPSGASTSEGFESDNDATGTSLKPKTMAIFSNFTMIGPYAAGETFNQHSSVVKSAYRRGARIRRNSGQTIMNSIFMGYRNGLMIDGAACEKVANITTPNSDCDTLEFRNNIFLGMVSQPTATSNGIIEVATGRDTALLYTWFKSGNNRINPVSWANGTLLKDPNNYTNPDFMPVLGSPALNGADFTNCKFSGKTELNNTKVMNYNFNAKAFPNPANDKVNLELTLQNSSELNISIISVSGKVVRNISDKFSSGTSYLTFEGLNSGIYFINIKGEYIQKNLKLLIN